MTKMSTHGGVRVRSRSALDRRGCEAAGSAGRHLDQAVERRSERREPQPHRLKLTFERVQHEAERLEREGTQESVVVLFAQDDGTRSVDVTVAEVAVGDPALDERTVDQGEV